MTVEAYAKINLTLEVLGERSDGYHALRSVVLPVSLSDTLDIETTDDGRIVCDSGFGDDLCVRAALRLREAAGNARLGTVIRVDKRIPAGGGLGGGSADAAATLRALNGLWRLGLSCRALVEVGALVGSDVPALTMGGAVLMEGRGEVVSRLWGDEPPAALPRLNLVLVNPGVFCSTPEVFARCTSRLQSEASIVYNMRTALASGDLKGIAEAMTNDLQKPAVALHPEIAEAMAALTDAGAEAVLMSGSGSTVFGLVPTEARGREIAASLSAKGFWAKAVRALDCPVV